MNVTDTGECFNISCMLMGIEWILEEEDGAHETCCVQLLTKEDTNRHVLELMNISCWNAFAVYLP